MLGYYYEVAMGVTGLPFDHANESIINGSLFTTPRNLVYKNAQLLVKIISWYKVHNYSRSRLPYMYIIVAVSNFIWNYNDSSALIDTHTGCDVMY